MLYGKILHDFEIRFHQCPRQIVRSKKNEAQVLKSLAMQPIGANETKTVFKSLITTSHIKDLKKIYLSNQIADHEIRMRFSSTQFTNFNSYLHN